MILGYDESANVSYSVDLGSLEEVDGGFNLQSSDSKFSCENFDNLRDTPTIRGTYKCKAATDHPTNSNGNSGTSTSHSNVSGTDTSNTASSSAAVPATGLAALFFALVRLV